MSTYKHFERFCLITLSLLLLLLVLFLNARKPGIQTAFAAAGYESRLFDTSLVHTVDIVMDDWDGFLETCTDEDYVSCTVLIDGEACRNVGLRAKGNTSLSQVAAYGNDRYSFKIEFDHYDDGKTYYGLDKLCLNNVIQDNTYMKEFFSYRIMAEAGAPAPLCSYVNISVNGEPWGLYLAVEGIEEAFLTRNYGNDYGELYKPDGMDIGGGNRGRSLSGSSDVLLQYTDEKIDSYPNIFDNAKTDASAADKKRLIKALKNLNDGEALESTVDADSVIRYFVAHNFVVNFDSYTGSMIHNYYLYEKDGRLSMLPWDYNLAFGGFASAGGIEDLINYPIDTPVSDGNVEDRPMLAWIFSDEACTEQYHQCFSQLLSEYFESGRFAGEMDLVTSMISPYVEEDPTKFCTFEEFERGADTLKEFCLLRAESIRGQLDGTIGRESDTQEPDTLIDAGSLSLSDMGSMAGFQMGGGGEMPERPENDTMPKMPENGSTPETPENGNIPETPADGSMSEGNAMPERPQRGGMPGEPGGEGMPGMPTGGMVSESGPVSSSAPLLLTALSIVVLLGGLLFARLFKTRI